jgi:alpha-galactosidase
MVKIAFIGAGSTVFARNLLGDILGFPELSGATIALMDIDPERLRTSEIVAHKVAAVLGAKPVIQVTLDRREALDRADYVISMIQVAGYRPGTLIDFEIPKRYGLRQTIADTLGIGGIMRGLRTIPVLLDICRDMEELCPGAHFLQYVNPMAMNCWAIGRVSPIKTIGLCHSVQGTALQLADDIGVPYGEIDYLSAGINHMAFYLRFARDGEDLYPRIRQVIAEARIPDDNRVRYELFERFGYFVTESSEHFAEYVPWFIRHDRPDLIEQFNIPLDEYIRRCEKQIASWHALRRRLEDGAALEVRRSHEYGALIIHSIETGNPRTIYGNVPNAGTVRSQAVPLQRESPLLISNLPPDCCVEVPCAVDARGIQPQAVGALPPQLAALMQTNINVQALTVEAALTHKREHVYHAAMLDPHTAAELSLDQIVKMVDELIAAHGAWIPEMK